MDYDRKLLHRNRSPDVPSEGCGFSVPWKARDHSTPPGQAACGIPQGDFRPNTALFPFAFRFGLWYPQRRKKGKERGYGCGAMDLHTDAGRFRPMIMIPVPCAAWGASTERRNAPCCPSPWWMTNRPSFRSTLRVYTFGVYSTNSKMWKMIYRFTAEYENAPSM